MQAERMRTGFLQLQANFSLPSPCRLVIRACECSSGGHMHSSYHRLMNIKLTGRSSKAVIVSLSDRSQRERERERERER